MTLLPPTLDAAIAAECERYDALARVLQDETQALCHGDIDAVERTAAAKLALVRELERLTAHRVALAAQAPAAHAAAALAPLVARAGEARRVNALNGRLIDRRQQYTARSLAALRGAAGGAPVYGPDGQAPAIPLPLARATA
ncbi:MAG TPA: flagellar protein FlgN [Casimicrobiaceae bacterium]|jgi:flagellar biosynthesis/type III secretory pathway chaperone|nr:flagellar protein FlgN [Casimicrobiaceae bacterium]